jgi:hypothetical protein
MTARDAFDLAVHKPTSLSSHSLSRTPSTPTNIDFNTKITPHRHLTSGRPINRASGDVFAPEKPKNRQAVLNGNHNDVIPKRHKVDAIVSVSECVGQQEMGGGRGVSTWWSQGRDERGGTAPTNVLTPQAHTHTHTHTHTQTHTQLQVQWLAIVATRSQI